MCVLKHGFLEGVAKDDKNVRGEARCSKVGGRPASSISTVMRYRERLYLRAPNGAHVSLGRHGLQAVGRSQRFAAETEFELLPASLAYCQSSPADVLRNAEVKLLQISSRKDIAVALLECESTKAFREKTLNMVRNTLARLDVELNDEHLREHNENIRARLTGAEFSWISPRRLKRKSSALDAALSAGKMLKGGKD